MSIRITSKKDFGNLLPLTVCLVVLLFFGPYPVFSAEGEASSYLPRRIVSLGPINTENVFLLGAGDLLVGDTNYCRHPEEALYKEKIGSLLHVSVEKIIALQPDLVLATSLSAEDELIKLTAVGIRVERFRHAASYQEIREQFLALGRLLGREEVAAQKLLDIDKRIKEVVMRVRNLPSQRVFLQVGTKPLAGSVPTSFTNDFLVLGGGQNILADQKRPAVQLEKVLVHNPQVIFIAIMGQESELATEEKVRWSHYTEISAVRDQRIHIIDPDLVCSPSPETFARALEYLAQLIHPEGNWENHLTQK